MHPRDLIAGLCLLALVSCSGQRGYMITGGGSTPLPNSMPGTIRFDDGIPAGRLGAGTSDAPTRLLSIMFLAPGAERRVGGSGRKSEGSTEHYELSQGMGENEVSIDFTWDKVADELEIEGTTYDRADGAFIVIVKPVGEETKVWQLKVRDARPLSQELIMEAAKQLPHVEPIQALLDSTTVQRGERKH